MDIWHKLTPGSTINWRCIDDVQRAGESAILHLIILNRSIDLTDEQKYRQQPSKHYTVSKLGLGNMNQTKQPRWSHIALENALSLLHMLHSRGESKPQKL